MGARAADACSCSGPKGKQILRGAAAVFRATATTVEYLCGGTGKIDEATEDLGALGEGRTVEEAPSNRRMQLTRAAMANRRRGRRS